MSSGIKKKGKINVYDFDYTIYSGDSSLDFYFYNLRRQPSILFHLPYQLINFVLFRLHIIDRTTFKERFFSFLRHVKNKDGLINNFWNTHARNIKDWYLESEHTADVIVSASPFFLLEPIAKGLKARELIATNMNIDNGHIEGVNCHGKEKVRRLLEHYDEQEIEKVYSDSLADVPLFGLANEAWVVVGDRFILYKEYRQLSAVKRILLRLRFI